MTPEERATLADGLEAMSALIGKAIGGKTKAEAEETIGAPAGSFDTIQESIDMLRRPLNGGV